MKQLLFRISFIVFSFLKFFLITESSAAQLQIGKEIKETLDSITSPARKEYYSYDASGNNTMTVTKVIDYMTNRWLYEYKEESAYNAAGKITSWTRNKWNSISENWLKELKTTYSYNASKQITSVTQYKWISLSQDWLMCYREECSYNERGNKLASKLFTQQADTTIQAILTSSQVCTYNTKGLQTLYIGTSYDAKGKKSYRKNIFNYDEKANLTEQIEYLAQEDSIWKQEIKVVYLYSNANKLVNKTVYSFNENSNQWLVFYQTTRKYDASGNEIELVDSIVFQDQKIVELSKSLKEYNAAGKEISSVVFTRKPAEANWKYASKFERTYDNLNQLQTYATSTWVDSLKNWVQLFKRNTIRNADNDVISEYQYVLDSNNKWVGLWKLEWKRGSGLHENTAIPLTVIDSSKYRINSSLHYSWYSGEWLAPGEEVYHYSERTVSGLTTSSPEESTFTISPNPAKDYFTVQKQTHNDLLAIEITDMQGQKVLSKDLKSNTPVSVSDLKRGIYLYRISDDNKTTSGKLVVE